MIIADRLRAIRESRKLSQGDIQKRTGLLRVYISKIENGHITPSIETLEKIARAFEMPMWELFYDGEEPPATMPPRVSGWGSKRQEARALSHLRRSLANTSPRERELLLAMASQMASRKPSKTNRAA